MRQSGNSNPGDRTMYTDSYTGTFGIVIETLQTTGKDHNRSFEKDGIMTASMFRKMVGLPEAKWSIEDSKNKEQVVAQSDDVHDDSVNLSVTQSRISDFMPS